MLPSYNYHIKHIKINYMNNYKKHMPYLTSNKNFTIIHKQRGVAKFGIALGSGPRGLGFESRHSDQKPSTKVGGFLIFIITVGHL